MAGQWVYSIPNPQGKLPSLQRSEIPFRLLPPPPKKKKKRSGTPFHPFPDLHCSGSPFHLLSILQHTGLPVHLLPVLQRSGLPFHVLPDCTVEICHVTFCWTYTMEGWHFALYLIYAVVHNIKEWTGLEWNILLLQVENREE